MTAVLSACADLGPDDVVVVGCSGGADSLALAAGVAHARRRGGPRGIGVVVDHRLQPGSDRVAADAVEQLTDRLALWGSRAVSVDVPAGPGRGGPEAAARDVRRRALAAAAQECGAGAILLGHTRDDQAETVLLGLARGSGARSLAGMSRRDGPWRRPLLGLARAQVRGVLPEIGLAAWEDPHNTDPSYARVRVRGSLLPALERELGPGIAEALARTAGLLRDDADALDEWAERVMVQARGAAGSGLDVVVLQSVPDAVRTRVVRREAVRAGCPAGALTREHILAVDRLLTAWHGQGAVSLPGGVSAGRAYGRLWLHHGGAPPIEPDPTPE